MKYKQMYEELSDKVESLKYLLEERELTELQAKKERDMWKIRYEEVNNFLSKIEGLESDVRRENEWLKTTLRLVIVDADKIKGLANELERNQSSLSYKI